METLFCPKCRENVEFYTEIKSRQNTARCMKCDTFIKNIPYDKPRLYVGKYKGKAIEEIDDLNYLIWAQKTLKVKQGIKDALQKQISMLEHLAK